MLRSRIHHGNRGRSRELDQLSETPPTILVWRVRAAADSSRRHRVEPAVAVARLAARLLSAETAAVLSDAALGSTHGFLLSGGTYTTIDDPSATNGTFAEAINDRGQIVGFYQDRARSTHGFLLSGGVYTTLDDLSGAQASGTQAGTGRQMTTGKPRDVVAADAFKRALVIRVARIASHAARAMRRPRTFDPGQLLIEASLQLIR